LNRLRFRVPALLLAGSCVAGPALAADSGGRLVGFVEDARGTPVSGALISLFGNGLEGGGLVAFSDASGRFVLSALPAGSYTLRALGGRLRAQARQVTVLPNQESIFSVSLFSPEESADEDEIASLKNETAAQRELKWLVRHKRRSILEELAHSVGDGEESERAAQAPPPGSEAPLEGALEVVAHSGGSGDGEAGVPLGGLGLVRLGGRLGESMSWSLGGLASESESASWRMAAEFVVEPDEDHQVVAGAGYGSRWLTPFLPQGVDPASLESRSVGVLFAEERWQMTRRVWISAGGRYSYIGFLDSPNHLDPTAALEFEANPSTRFRASAASRTLTPGGDLLTLSTLAMAPALDYAVMDAGLRPERLTRYEISVSHGNGPVRLGARVFHEGFQDPYVNVFQEPGRALRIANAPSVRASGLGVSVGRRFGQSVDGSVSYTYGHSSRQGRSTAPAAGTVLVFPENDFHDFVARLQAVLRPTDTRIVAFCRVNTLTPDAEGPGTEGDTFTRFDVQLSQGIPFLGDLTRADWELLLAYRNLFYEATEGGTLDELAVVNPPSRVLGGITVRF
jgi:hypothetical protein